MKKIKNKLFQRELILKEKQAPVLDYLNPGLDKGIIAELLNINKVNDSFLALYEWHNGISLSNEDIFQSVIEIMPMGIFYSIEDVINTRKDILTWKYLKLEHPENYLPFMGSGEDDIYLLENNTGEVFYISPAIQEYGSLEFRSVESMLDCIIECYKKEIFIIDPERGLEANFDRFCTIKEGYK